jgi:hypothetical protein
MTSRPSLEETRKPFCTICGFDFDGPGLERICHHRVLPVPLCAVCFDDLETNEIQRKNDKLDCCSWCGEGGELFLCDACPSCFCEVCIENQLGKSALEMVRNSDPWNCFACDNSPLSGFQDFLDLQSDQDLFPRTLDAALSLLAAVEDEIVQCQHFHEDSSALGRVCHEIANELRAEGRPQYEIILALVGSSVIGKNTMVRSPNGSKAGKDIGKECAIAVQNCKNTSRS